MEEICAAVTTYRPGGELPERIAGHLKQVGKVVLVDDGGCAAQSQRLSDWFGCYPEVVLCHHTENRGIAAALNSGIQMARQLGYQWILTLDDDTQLLPGASRKLIDAWRELASHLAVAVVGLSWQSDSSQDREAKPVWWKSKRAVITSGSLFPLVVYEE